MNGPIPTNGLISRFWSAGWTRMVRRRREAQGFDLAWARWTITALTLGLAPVVIAVPAGVVWPEALVTAALGALICAYFGHILVRRLQCSLLEGVVLVAMLGNAAGLIVTMPGMARALHVSLPFVVLMSAWGLYAAVVALAQARLMDVNGYVARCLFLALGWLASASPVMLALAAALWFGKDYEQGMLVSERMAGWVVPLLALGVLGLAARLVLGRMAIRAARRILNEP